MNLSRPDRLQRLDALAAEYALGTLPPRARLRLERVALDDSDGRGRDARLGIAIGAADRRGRADHAAAARMDRDRQAARTQTHEPSRRHRGGQALSVWRGLALASMVARDRHLA